MVVSHYGVLAIEPESSGRTVSVFNFEAISLVGLSGFWFFVLFKLNIVTCLVVVNIVYFLFNFVFLMSYNFSPILSIIIL